MSKRLAALDIQRGFIMMLMALDRVVAFVYRYHPSEVWAGMDALFLVGTLCHPVCHPSVCPWFFCWMGAGVALFWKRGVATAGRMTRRAAFVKARTLLLLINQVIENRAWSIGFMTSCAPPVVPDGPWPGTPGPMLLVFSVLSGLGMALVLASLLLALAHALVGDLCNCFGLGIDGLYAVPDHLRQYYSLPMRLLFLPGQTGVAFVLYPLIPWSGLALWGLVLGRSLHEKSDATLAKLPWIGL